MTTLAIYNITNSSSTVFDNLVITDITLTQSVNYMSNPVATSYSVTDNAVIIPQSATATAYLTEPNSNLEDFITVVNNRDELSLQIGNYISTSFYISQVKYDLSGDYVNNLEIDLTFTQVIEANISVGSLNSSNTKDAADYSTLKSVTTSEGSQSYDSSLNYSKTTSNS